MEAGFIRLLMVSTVVDGLAMMLCLTPLVFVKGTNESNSTIVVQPGNSTDGGKCVDHTCQVLEFVHPHTLVTYHHENYSNSKTCLRTDKIDSYWYNDVCKHIPLPVAVATTTFHCYNNGTCESGGWVPVQKQDDWN